MGTALLQPDPAPAPKKKTSTTQRTMDRARKLGWIVCKTEHRVYMPGMLASRIVKELEVLEVKAIADEKTEPVERSAAWHYGRGVIAALDIANQIAPEYAPPPTTRDLWGFVDLVALRPRTALLPRPWHDYVHIQVTSGTNLAARMTKIQEECRDEALALLCVPGVSIEVWGWRQLAKSTAKKLGNARQTWWAKRVQVCEQDGLLFTKDLEDL